MTESTPAPPQPASPKMDGFKMAVDYAGAVAFLVTYLLSHQILAATFALVAGSAVGLGACLVVRKKIAPLPAIYGTAALVFGGLTLIFRDPTIIKMKTTAIDAALGLVMLGGLALGRSPIKLLMGEAVELTNSGWKKLTLRFGLFFLALAGLNEFVWRTQSEAHWVWFRMPGMLILTLVFAVAQTPLILREAHVAHEKVDP